MISFEIFCSPDVYRISVYNFHCLLLVWLLFFSFTYSSVVTILEFLNKGLSIKYVSIFEGGGVFEMLTLADMGEGGYLKC